jgi:hypothetical protein
VLNHDGVLTIAKSFVFGFRKTMGRLVDRRQGQRIAPCARCSLRVNPHFSWPPRGPGTAACVRQPAIPINDPRGLIIANYCLVLFHLSIGRFVQKGSHGLMLRRSA